MSLALVEQFVGDLIMTVMYDMVVIEGSMPSLTLHLGGKDRSVINRHFPGLDRLGITPIWLSCMFG